MPPLTRHTKPLLSTVGGKPSSADHPATTSSAAGSSSPSAVPKPAPLPEGKSIDADPESSSSDREGSDDDHKFASSPFSSSAPTSPFKVPNGRKGIRAPAYLGGRGAMAGAANGKRARGAAGAGTSTQDSTVGLDDDEDKTDLFGEMNARPAKHRRTTTYGNGVMSIEASRGSGKAKKTAGVGYGSKSGSKSVQSTPAKNIHVLAKTAASTGRAGAKKSNKGTPLSDVSVNATNSRSSERLPGESAGAGMKMLDTLEPIASSPPLRTARPKAKHMGTSETRLPREKPNVKLLGPLPEMRKENNPTIKKLPAINFSPQTRSSPQIRRLAPIQSPPSLARCTRSTSLSESQECEIIDLTAFSKAITGNSKPDSSNKDGLDTPTKVKALKMLPSIDGGTSSNPESKTTATRRSSRRNKGQAPDDSTHLPQTTSNHEHDHSSIKASSPLVGDFGDLDDDDHDGPNPNGNYETPAKCPVCQAPVDRVLLEEWQGSRAYMRIRKQMEFCEAHRRATAREEYAAREYPNIDFDALSTPPIETGHGGGDGGNGGTSGGRIERFRDDLVGVIRRERPSAFRDAADEAAARGEGRNLKKTVAADEALTGMTVGYYGPRGRRVMEAWVTRELADEIRESAGRDRLIGFKTVSGFIQEVLVPELAMRLVAEDLDVGEARAREVLRESGEIGELVNGVDDDGEERKGGGAKVAKKPVGGAAAAADDEDGGDY
ncbi:hypothetical protein BK809_0007494 [Diplodia seriata]|uniref:Restriction of telomere capping protein 4 n=1 Tax=Diplodia seriata TaxID=420778 RepID=A0A1S8BJH9_9PEZI|nr:hypothetical protein BK809_0007494 [Diplodia seriata]